MNKRNEFFKDIDFINKSIEELENDYWEEPEFKSGLTMICHKARKKLINELTDDEIGTLIRQRIALKYLLPVAVKKIENYLCILVDFYSSNLLDTLFRLNDCDWIDNEKAKERLLMNLHDCSSDLNEEYKKLAEKFLNDNKFNY